MVEGSMRLTKISIQTNVSINQTINASKITTRLMAAGYGLNRKVLVTKLEISGRSRIPFYDREVIKQSTYGFPFFYAIAKENFNSF